jgi:hypothetical protein
MLKNGIWRDVMAKRKFFLGVGAALSVVVAGVGTTNAIETYADKTGTELVIKNSIISDLIMQESEKSAESIQVAGHSSHSSHGSHGSHISHSSHSSGY